MKFRHVILKTSKEKRQSNHLEGVMFVTPNSPLTYMELYGSQLGEILSWGLSRLIQSSRGFLFSTNVFHWYIIQRTKLSLALSCFFHLQQRLSAEEDKRIAEIQKQIVETTNKNRATFQLTDTVHLVRILNSLVPRSDWQVTSPHNIPTLSSKQAMRKLKFIM